jgi:hypothetical protein
MGILAIAIIVRINTNIIPNLYNVKVLAHPFHFLMAIQFDKVPLNFAGNIDMKTHIYEAKTIVGLLLNLLLSFYNCFYSIIIFLFERSFTSNTTEKSLIICKFKNMCFTRDRTMAIIASNFKPHAFCNFISIYFFNFLKRLIFNVIYFSVVAYDITNIYFQNQE